ncbi:MULTISPECIES: hypothetical protein [unclassified Bradyrhizobium]|uniref:hypothetical protein n=1 Tax=unclassified Bradyrhizobium TaxID=2631580 RepID=UPI0020B43BB5|nr:MULTISPECIES: hypothetical protein [unclassified Bradyrhizobium]MCP3460811.1 hypothetical protein [Bradyrhizobium sp. CCGUVB23]MCP3475745.1 hypothetical protein [Bradyrhizobium sp. CCGUVB1N3]
MTDLRSAVDKYLSMRKRLGYKYEHRMGMRISEAMGLECDDVDLEAGVLTVRLTKFGKYAAGSCHCIRRREPRCATTPTGATRCSGQAAARPSSLPNREAAC